LADAHPVERPVNEDKGHDEESTRERARKRAAGGGRQSHSEFHGGQAEERCELDDGIESDGRSVLERIADRIADDGGVMQRCFFFPGAESAPVGSLLDGGIRANSRCCSIAQS
jgi:hypothetical protein